MTRTTLNCVHDSENTVKPVTCTIVPPSGSGAGAAAIPTSPTTQEPEVNLLESRAFSSTSSAPNALASLGKASATPATATLGAAATVAAKNTTLKVDEKGYVIRDGKILKLTGSNTVKPTNDYYIDEAEAIDALSKRTPSATVAAKNTTLKVDEKGYVIRDGKILKLTGSNTVKPTNDYYIDEAEAIDALSKRTPSASLAKGGKRRHQTQRKQKRKQSRVKKN